MTFFEPIPSIEARALDMDHMHDMLAAIAASHRSLHQTVPVYKIWQRVSHYTSRDTRNQQDHINAAREAGFVTEEPSSGTMATRLRLTDKGYAAIGIERPFWECAA